MKSFGKLAVILMTSLASSTAQNLENGNDCRWPLERFRDLFIIACDAYNCEEKVTNCTEAMIPRVNLCPLKDACKTETMGRSGVPTSPSSANPLTRQMSNCVMQKTFDMLNIVYMPGDNLMNAVKYINSTFGPNSGFDEALKLSMMESIVDDICIAPEGDNEMEALKFEFCLLKVCVDNLPDYDYEYDSTDEYDPNAKTGEAATDVRDEFVKSKKE